MATNENVNKVIYGNQTVMDITDTTAEESDVASGEVFYKANGARSVGTLNADSAVWGNISGTLSDQTDLQTELNRAYTKTASEISSLDDLDLIPVQDISASSDGRRNIKFRNLKTILTNFFDTVYQTILTLPLSTANGGTGNSTGRVTVGQKSGVTLGDKATSEGNDTESTGFCSHAEGGYTKATNSYAHADGYYTEANGYASHASGRMTKVTEDHQFAVGILNDPKQDTIFEVGNGKSIGQVRSNAFEVYNDGHINVNGDIYQNGELYNKQIYADNGVLGAKNLLSYPYSNKTKTVSGITFTDNGDGSITINGTSTEDWITFYMTANLPLKSGKYILSAKGFPSDNTSAKIRIIGTQLGTGINDVMIYNDNNGALIELPVDTDTADFNLTIRTAGTVCNNVTIRPMLRLASDPDDTYVPYAMTNRELTEEKLSISELKTIASSAADFAAFKTAIANL